jgi:predicted  nucleic acid-binding Zn-ribbon protein
VNDVERILKLHDVDVLREELADSRTVSRLKKLGFTFPEARALDAERAGLLAALERRWLHHYERAHSRYGRAVAIVRGRVCQGCFITLPTSATPSDGTPLTTCESCARILLWPTGGLPLRG